jgi:glycosyltransferase involved in cell wall biosynthesis
MNILVIASSERPRPDGNYLRFRNLFPRLASRHALHLCYLDRHGEQSYLEAHRDGFTTVKVLPYLPASAPLGHWLSHLTFRPDCSLRWRDAAAYGRIRAEILGMIRLLRIELVHCWERCSEELVDNCRVPVLFDMCDALSLDMLRSLVLRWSFREYLRYVRMRRFESGIVRRFPCTFVTDQDAGFFKRQRLTRVIPNGVDADADFLAADELDNVIAFSGNMGFQPNVDAVMYFHREIFPIIVASRPSVRWFIIGTEPAPAVLSLAEDPRIVVTGHVDDLRGYLQRATVVVCPMVTGTGIKNKVLEAMSLGRAVVSTPLGAQGIAVSPGANIVVAAKPQEFATKVLELLADRGLRQRMGMDALDLVLRHYSWAGSADALDDLYREVAGVGWR